MTDPALHAQQIRLAIEGWLSEQIGHFDKIARRIPSIHQEPLGLRRWQYKLNVPWGVVDIAVYQAKVPGEPFFGTVDTLLGEIPDTDCGSHLRKESLVNNLFLFHGLRLADLMGSLTLGLHMPLEGTAPIYWVNVLEEVRARGTELRDDLLKVGLWEKSHDD